MVGPYNAQNFSSGIASKQMKIQNPDDLNEVIQIRVIDTGNVTAKGERIFALGTALSLGLTSDGPNNETSLAFPMTGGTDSLPVTTDARSVWLQNDPANANDILVFGVMNLGPGESIVISTDDDASWITVVGTGAQILNYAILRRT